MVDWGNDPGQSESHEHVDRVAARHVTDGIVRSLLIDGRNLASEGVRQGGAQRYEGDGSDLKGRGGITSKLIPVISIVYRVTVLSVIVMF